MWNFFSPLVFELLTYGFELVQCIVRLNISFSMEHHDLFMTSSFLPLANIPYKMNAATARKNKNFQIFVLNVSAGISQMQYSRPISTRTTQYAYTKIVCECVSTMYECDYEKVTHLIVAYMDLMRFGSVNEKQKLFPRMLKISI